MHQIVDDLSAEHLDLDHIVAAVDLATPTPADGWTVGDQISHLWYFDRQAVLAIVAPERFSEGVAALLQSHGDGTDASLAGWRDGRADALIDRWREDRSRLVELARTIDPTSRIPWYGPPMSARSFVTARLMETWAHGQDIVDAIGGQRLPTGRLRHVAHIGVGARAYSYVVNGREQPAQPVAVRLSGPSGDEWAWGPDDAADRVEGAALDFCLAVTQRRHLSDTALVVTGDHAVEWMSFAQAFAGPAGPGRQPS